METSSHSAEDTHLSPKTRRFSRRPVLFASAQVGEDAAGIILNISEAGMCVQTAQEISGDRLLRLRFQSLRSREWVEVEGKIVWRNEDKTVAGIEFVDLTAEARQEVRTWLSFGNSLQELRGNWATRETETAASAEADAVPFDWPSGEQGNAGAAPPDSHATDHPASRPDAAAPESALRLLGGELANPPAVRQTSRAATFAIALLVIFLGILAGRHAPFVQRVEVLFSKKTAAVVPNLPAPGPSAAAEPPNPPAPPPLPAGASRANAKPAPVATPVRAATPASSPKASSLQAGGEARFELQVAAMSLEENASRLAESLRLKNFPVFVSKQPGDHLYKVVVGPYPDTQAARSAKDDLEKDGIKPIVKRWTP